MPSCEVQRTLVKSPPELWSELSDPASLAKHLGDFGAIRIARVEPETAVEWEAGSVRGAVQLKPSGWGTKVTLTAERELPAAEAPPEADERPEVAAPSEADNPDEVAAPPAAETPPKTIAPPEPEAILEPQAMPEHEAIPEPGPERRRSLFARIFRRRKELPVEPQALVPEEDVFPEEAGLPEEPGLPEESTIAEVPAPTEAQDPESLPPQEPAPLETSEQELATNDPPDDLAAELAAVEQAMLEQDTALLTAVLDRLGAAHHRPFSRG